MSKKKAVEFPLELFVTREEGEKGSEDYFLASADRLAAFDGTAVDATNQVRIGVYKLDRVERVMRDLLVDVVE